MNVSDLPLGTFVGAAAKPVNLARLLIEATNSRDPFVFYDIVHGRDRSGRLLLRERIDGLRTEEVSWPRPISAEEAAKDFFGQTMKAARFPEPKPEQQGWAKGWAVASFRVGKKQAVVVWAAWVLPRA